MWFSIAVAVSVLSYWILLIPVVEPFRTIVVFVNIVLWAVVLAVILVGIEPMPLLHLGRP
jgi:hypothetical protein